MLPEVYKKLKKEFDEWFRCTDTIIKTLNQNCDNDVLTLFRDNIWNYRNALLNNYFFNGNQITNELENVCGVINEIIEKKKGFGELEIVCKKLPEIFNVSVNEKECYLANVLIAKNEAPYIVEWIEFHKMVGVSHFYIYDNESEDNFREVLEPYIKNGEVTYHYFSGTKKQLEAYNHAIANYKLDVRYMAFIDADEFLLPMEKETLPETIEYIIRSYETSKYRADCHAAGIGVNWRIYGSSGHDTRPDGLVTENYKYRAIDDFPDNVLIKTICNPRLVEKFELHPHSCKYKPGYWGISEKGSFIPGACFYDSICSRIRINHYYMKSKEEYIKKCLRGWPDAADSRLPEEEAKQRMSEYIDECNKVYDPIMEKYISKLKKRIQEKN